MKRSLITVTLLLCFLYESIGQTCFAPAVNIPLGTNLSARSITCTDFNKDGKPDLATANYYGTSILIGKGDGTFRVTTSATGTTGGPLAITHADFNNDGKMDIATSNGGSGGGVTILLGNGLGMFAKGVNYPVNTSYAITTADYNGDGFIDIAVTNGIGGGGINIIFGNGAGGFSLPTNIPVPGEIRDFISLDINNDNKVDLITVNGSTTSNISVLLGNGLGGFLAPNNFPVANDARTIASGDFNKDGKKDLAIATSQNVSVLMGNGNGSFGNVVNFPNNGGPRSIVCEDYNGDGMLDLAITIFNKVAVMLGNGTGSFAAPTTSIVSNCFDIVNGDFNGDGYIDLATSDNATNVSILLGLFEFTVSKTDATCYGVANGSAKVTVTCGKGPFSYYWYTNPPQTTATANRLGGSITVTVTDANNNSKSQTVVINQPLPITATISSTSNTKCSGICNGTASITNIAGGLPPYTYQWNSSANNQTTPTAISLCNDKDYYNVSIKDANLCSVTKYVQVNVASIANSNIYLTNLAAVDQVNASPSFSSYYTYNLPEKINAPTTNPRNFVDPGKRARFKVECTNKKANGQSIVSGICKVRTNNPYITITDSSSALNNIGWNNKAWSADEFEINISQNTPTGTNAYIDFIVQESGQNYSTTCIPIPITPLVYSPTTPSTIDDDSNPDSKGNDNDICDPNETVEFYPWLDNISTLNAEYVRGRFENLDNHNYIKIWNNRAGVGTTVYDATWWNYAFAKPQTINSNSSNTTPEFDFVFDYTNTKTVNDFKLYMVMAGGFNLFPSNGLSLVQWTLPFTFNGNEATGIESENKIKEYLIVYPNPANDFVTVENKNHKSPLPYNITNSIGQIVLVGQLFEEKNLIDIKDLTSGVYFLKLGGESKQSYKLIKK